MIRAVREGDHRKLTALWEEVFGDSPEDVAEYLALRCRDEDMLAEVSQGEIAGMLSMLPLMLRSGSRSFTARYIYAVATHPNFRSQGVSTRLLEEAHLRMQAWGDAAAVLMPASPSLFGFYGKRGYRTAFFMDLLTVRAQDLPPCPRDASCVPCGPEEYTRLRDAAFASSRLYACWAPEAVAYAMKTFSQPGGVLRLAAQGGMGCAAWERHGEEVLIRELALNGLTLPLALSVLNGTLNAQAYRVRLPEGSAPGSQTLPVGMIRWLVPEPELSGGPPYLALTLD